MTKKISQKPTEDERLRRLLFSEVLLDEYESQCPRARADGVAADDENAPPRLDPGKVEKLRKVGGARRVRCDDIGDETGRDRFELQYEGELVSRVYTLMVEAQEADAKAKIAELHKKYAGMLDDPKLPAWAREAKGDARARIIDRAVVADIHGIFDDYRDRFRREKADIEDGERRERVAESMAFRAVIAEESRAGCDPLSDEPMRAAATPGNGGPAKVAACEPKHSGNGGPPPKGSNRVREARNVYARTRRSALCLSGGGIRSATFNLGILQGLARHGLLEQFDYLSTVSGGGFAGSFLTAWMHRRGTRDVVEELSRSPRSPLAPEPPPIDYLRVFSNYLSPRLGLLSADTWTLVATLLRNMILTWLVFVPFLILALMLPRFWLALVTKFDFPAAFPRGLSGWASGNASLAGAGVSLPASWSFWVGVVAGWVALTYTGFNLSRPRRAAPPRNPNPYKSSEARFLWLGLLPSAVSALALSVYWSGFDEAARASATQGRFILFMVALVGVPWLFTAVYRMLRFSGGAAASYTKTFAFGLRRFEQTLAAGNKVLRRGRGAGRPRRTKRVNFQKAVARFWGHAGSAPFDLMNVMSGYRNRLGAATILIMLAQVLTGILLHFVAVDLLPSPGGAGASDACRLYATFSLPLFMVVLMLDCALFAGLTSGFTKDADQEWWARSHAWYLIVVIVWSATSLLVFYGPSIILSFWATIQRVAAGGEWGAPWKTLGQAATVLGGVVSGVITLVGGFTAKTGASGEGAESTGRAGRLMERLASVLAPAFLAFLMILIAIGTDWLLTSRAAAFLYGMLPAWARTELPTEFANSFPASHETLVALTPFSLLLLLGVVVLAFGLFIGLLINSNAFSLHYMWRNRIIRAYLGASRARRNPNSFTGFDEGDDIYMHELREQPAGAGRATTPDSRPDSERPAGVPCPHKLLHVLNVALNLAGGDKLAWQDRKAESFTVSPLHAGCYWLGYRRSSVYGGENGISLGTAVAISGAFVSPNMGYMMESPVVRFLMTLFNVRFGWWLGNPGRAGDDSYPAEKAVGWLRGMLFGTGRSSAKPFELKSPLLSVGPIAKEAFGETNDKAAYVYLSDGGHFENLGLYEMVLRRCRYIVISDASTDSGYSFDSLAQSVRQIRVDLGVPIELREMSISRPAQDLKGKYCAVGKIRYSCIDRKPKVYPEHRRLKDEDFDGILIYIKASMIGEEPRDVINYSQGSADFPQEVIVDQWFSEAQFESYRALGSHIIDAVCGDDQNRVSLASFARKVKEHNQMNWRAFRDRIGYIALENQFKRSMRDGAPEGFRDRVKHYMDDLLG